MYTWEKNCRQCVGRYPTIYSFKRNKEGRRTRRGEVIIFGDGAAHISFQVGTKGGEGWPLICNRRLTYDDMISCFPTLTPCNGILGMWDTFRQLFLIIPPYFFFNIISLRSLSLPGPVFHIRFETLLVSPPLLREWIVVVEKLVYHSSRNRP